MRSIAFSNQKGGVAKTTSACAFAVALKNRGYRVLAVDMDPQGNLSDHVNAETETSMTVYELLKRKATPKDVIQHLDVFDIIPASLDLALAENEITQTGKEYRLREVLEPVKEDYDYIVVDTSPSLGTLTIMALTFVDEVIIPSNAEMFSLKGIKTLKTTIDDVRMYTNPKIIIAGILLTEYKKQTNLSKEMGKATQILSDNFDAPLFETRIRISTATGEAQANSLDIFSYKKKSNVAQDYEAFTSEYLKKKGDQK